MFRAVMEGVIYCYHCIVTGKKYIGQTVQEEIRKYRHLIDSKRLKSNFYNAVNKYGWESFIYGIIKVCDTDKLDEMEKRYISKYNTFNDGYNMTMGGDGCKKYENDFESISEYYKFYRENNKQRIREYYSNYYQENKEKKLQYEKDNRERRKEYMREYQQQWRKNNREKSRENCRKSYQKRKEIK